MMIIINYAFRDERDYTFFIASCDFCPAGWEHVILCAYAMVKPIASLRFIQV